MASSLSVGRTTLREYLSRADRAGLAWPLAMELSDVELETRLFPQRGSEGLGGIPQPDWAYVHGELGRKGVTLFLVLSRLRSGLPTLLGSLSFEGHALPGSGLCNKP